MVAPPLTVDGERLDEVELELLWNAGGDECLARWASEAPRDTARARSDLACQVAAVRAQLSPILTEAALLESYRRESVFLLASAPGSRGGPADVLEIAYALRWLELTSVRRAGTGPA